ncbi:MAG: hypothetical protein ACKO37_02200 [Vampirovibrionales bacterium]
MKRLVHSAFKMKLILKRKADLDRCLLYWESHRLEGFNPEGFISVEGLTEGARSMGLDCTEEEALAYLKSTQYDLKSVLSSLRSNEDLSNAQCRGYLEQLTICKIDDLKKLIENGSDNELFIRKLSEIEWLSSEIAFKHYTTVAYLLSLIGVEDNVNRSKFQELLKNQLRLLTFPGDRATMYTKDSTLFEALKKDEGDITLSKYLIGEVSKAFEVINQNKTADVTPLFEAIFVQNERYTHDIINHQMLERTSPEFKQKAIDWGKARPRA